MNTTKFNIRTRIDKKTNIQHLMLEGDLSINYIEQVKARVDALNIESADIVIELKKIESIDLSTIQLVHSLRKTLIEKGKSIKLISEMPEDVKPLLKNSGFVEFINS